MADLLLTFSTDFFGINFWYLIQILLEFVSEGLINTKSSMIQEMV